MMFKFYVKTGILFLILCGASGLPYAVKKVGDGRLKFEYRTESESEADLNRIKRTPHGYPDEEDTVIEPRFGGGGGGGGGYQNGGHHHGPIGYGHPGRGGWRHGPPNRYNHPVFDQDYHSYHHDSNFGHQDPNFGHRDSNYGPHDSNFNHDPVWHKNHPQFGHDHHQCNHHDHGYGEQPWKHNSHNGENTSMEPKTTNTLTVGKTNGDGFGDVKPVSEPNSDNGGNMGGIFTSSVTSSTEYPDIDIRAGV